MSQELYEYDSIGKRLVEKWGKLVDSIDNPRTKINTAILLENELQKGGMLAEADGMGTTSGQSAGGTTGSGYAVDGPGNDIAPFQHYLLPLVRRVYPNLIANELVGVQPMTSPTTLVFYLKYKYSGLVEQKASTVTGRIADDGVAKGQTAVGTQYGQFLGNTWNVDPYYSLQQIWREPIASAVAAGATTVAGAFAANTLLAFPRIAPTPLTVRWTLTDATNTVVVYATRNATGAQTGPTIIANTGAAFATVGGGVLTVTDTATSTTVAATALSWVGAFVATAVTANVSYEYNMENNRQLPEMELLVDRQQVSAKTRKLRTKWTIEASQDLKAMHNIDAEQELVSLLANEVTAEIDREIINELLIGALIRVEYNYSNPFLVGGTDNGAGSYVGGGSATGTFAVFGSGNFDDRNKALFYQILEVSNQIYRQSLRGAGNWIVTSPEIAAKLESLTEFRPDSRTDFTYNMGITQSGTLNGQFKVFKDPLFRNDLILVGFKGSSFMDSGYFYCPYIPLQLTPTVLDPETFNPRKGLVTRYGTVLVENGARMYGVIRVAGLTAIGADVLPGSDLSSTFQDAQKPNSTTGVLTTNPATDLI